MTKVVKAKIYKDRLGGKISILIENGSKETVFWVDEIDIDEKILKSLDKNSKKARYVDDPMGISEL